MALPPKFKGQRLLFFSNDATEVSIAEPLHTIEIYLDYVCPFSAKIFNTFVNSVAPKIRADPKLATKVQVIFRQQIQPWHPSSTLVHEAALAVLKLNPSKFWEFSSALFNDQKAYFDVNVVNEPRNATYKRLAKLGADSVGVSADELYKLLAIPEKAAADGSLNVGNEVTNDLKVVIKMARLVGVHVSPTVIFDGVVNNDISSGWTADQWLEWLALRFRARATPCHTPSRISGGLELTQQHLVRRASSSPKQGPNQPRPQFEIPPRSIIYHIGTPRIMFLGALKLTTVFVFGFFTVVVIPSYISADQPLWQTAGLTAASTIPFLAVWYLTSPMAVWIHLRIPNQFRRSKHHAERYLASLPADAELAITTMGALGKPRVSHVRVSDLRPARRRLGLVNYMRDVAAENARRRWWMFRAVGGFRIEDAVTTGKGPRYKEWEGVARQIRGKALGEGQ
ncbi:hypothetical protein VP1G_10186 [Cytospora mali]|uniref:Thioredoxin-like fold domain-containing protein n=1 Tax=Cytospora mali TaxID=578113 RepID=A0A194VGB3_CYTMA|nr:hypothetical protein VP1G_10186 [Valsa mali var. pyri (nom. inval.)]